MTTGIIIIYYSDTPEQVIIIHKHGSTVESRMGCVTTIASLLCARWQFKSLHASVLVTYSFRIAQDDIGQ